MPEISQKELLILDVVLRNFVDVTRTTGTPTSVVVDFMKEVNVTPKDIEKALIKFRDDHNRDINDAHRDLGNSTWSKVLRACFGAGRAVPDVGGYEVFVTKDEVEVGCQKFSHEAIQQLADAVRERVGEV